MMTLVSDAQVLLLAVVLAGAGLAKLLFPEPAPQPVAPLHGFPVPGTEPRWALLLRRNRRVAVAHGLVELALSAALLLSAHLVVRVAVALLMAASTLVVAELRQRTPDAGCGCFGGLSGERIGRREIVRAALLTAAAIATLGGTATGLQIAPSGPWQVWTLCALELAALTALSPEPAALLRRRRSAVPCERRRSPLSESLTTLRRSRPWRRHREMLDGDEPLDVWREGCWRFLTYPAHLDGRPVEVVFAVSTAHRGRAVRAAVVEPASSPAPPSPGPSQTVFLSAPPPTGPAGTGSPEVVPAGRSCEGSGPHYVMSR